MGVLLVRVVALLAVRQGLLREELSVQVDFVYQQLLLEAWQVIDQWLVVFPVQALIEGLIVFEVEFDAAFGWPVLDSNVDGDDHLGVVQDLKAAGLPAVQ